MVIALRSMAFAVLLYSMSIVEQLTRWWGVAMNYFTALPMNRTYSATNILVFLVPMLAFSFLGLFLGVVSKRWGSNGVLTLTALSIVVLGGAGVAIAGLGGWPAIGRWLANQPGLALAAGWTRIPLGMFAAIAYRLMRRAVP